MFDLLFFNSRLAITAKPSQANNVNSVYYKSSKKICLKFNKNYYDTYLSFFIISMKLCPVGKVLFGIDIRLSGICILDKLVYALRKTVFFSMNLLYILYLRYILLNIKIF